VSALSYKAAFCVAAPTHGSILVIGQLWSSDWRARHVAGMQIQAHCMSPIVRKVLGWNSASFGMLMACTSAAHDGCASLCQLLMHAMTSLHAYMLGDAGICITWYLNTASASCRCHRQVHADAAAVPAASAQAHPWTAAPGGFAATSARTLSSAIAAAPAAAGRPSGSSWPCRAAMTPRSSRAQREIAMRCAKAPARIESCWSLRVALLRRFCHIMILWYRQAV